MRNTTVLGIDPGSRHTGYGVVLKDGSKLVHVASGIISPGDKKPLHERLLFIYNGLKSVIDEFRPASVAVESLFFSANAKSAIVLGEARGVALLSAASAGLEVFEYAPRSVKQAVSGSGSASKEQMQKMVKLLLKTEETPAADAADALAIAVCHLSCQRGREAIKAAVTGPQAALLKAR